MNTSKNVPNVFVELFNEPQMLEKTLSLPHNNLGVNVGDELFELRDIIGLQYRYEKTIFPLSNWPFIYRWRDCTNIWHPHIQRASLEYMRETWQQDKAGESSFRIDYATLIKYMGGAISYYYCRNLDVAVQKSVMFFMADYLANGVLKSSVARHPDGQIVEAFLDYNKLQEVVINWSLYLYVKTVEIRREIVRVSTSVRSLSVALDLKVLKALLIEIKNKRAGVERRDIQQFLLEKGEDISDAEASSLITSLVTVNWLVKNGRVYGLTQFGESTISIL